MIRWLPAAMVAALLAAPVAAAQEKTPTADGSRGAAASVDTAGDAGRDRRA